jgi:glycosyltransferase involved in cell wall biosynthesis
MRALFLTKYGAQGASTRYRALQYLPLLAARGWNVEWQPLLPDRYLERLYLCGQRSFLEVGRAYVKRLAYLRKADLGSFDAVYVQCEVFPFVPVWLESALLAPAGNLVLDYDDAAFIPYDGRPFLRGKIPALMRRARTVIVGNGYLSQYASRYNERVSVIPTVVDLARYSPRQDYECRDERGLVIGWVGTPVTARYLSTMAGVLRQVARERAVVVRCAGTPAGFSIPGVSVESVPWSEATEAGIIRTFDIGVMPLAQEPFAKGKCGLKLIQYMACGVPAAGAKLGANAEIIRHGVDGFLASRDEEYVEAIERLAGDAALRAHIGRAGRRRVEERYSLQARAQEFCSVLERAANG